MNFKTLRLDQIAQHLGYYSQQSNLTSAWVILDYCHLAANYYENDYGTNWLTGKCQKLFEYGVSKIFLPKDVGSKGNPSNMDKMLAQLDDDDIAIKHIEDNENPWLLNRNIF